MTTSSAVHSQAFSFMQYLQGKFDPRTGQFTLAIDFPEVQSNWLAGPGFPVRLAFSPINIMDSGYGLGWNLNLTQYTPHNSILALHTGETFKVTGSGAKPDIKEKKLDTFHFEDLGNNRYRVYHKSGLVEVLQVGGSSNDRVALPVEIYSPAGHNIKLVHASFRGGQRLESISDAQGELLRINRPNDYQVEILARPSGGTGGSPLARYEMNLNASGWVTSIVLPSEDKASWRLSYQLIRGILCLTEIKTPVGGRETLEYTDRGHPYPGGVTRPNLPRVTGHICYPGFDQPLIRVDYSYTDHNFLGAGATVSWEEGMDPLYRVATDYEYGSIAKLMDGTNVVRTVELIFSRFHLLLEEKTTQQQCVKRVKTEYYASNLPFEQQLPQFQLPQKVTTSWELANDPTQYRAEVSLSAYDEYGNQTEQSEPNGRKTTYRYYAKTGEDGCPPDRFVRNLKETLVTPAPDGEPGALPLSTRLRYAAHRALTSSGLEDWLAVESETQVQLDGSNEIILQETQHRYHELPGDEFMHSRPSSQDVTLKGKTSRSSYTYERLFSALAGESVLQTTELFKGFDDAPGEEVRKVIISQNSLYHAQPLLSRDDNQVQIGYTYDPLNRVLSETVSPGEPEFEATRFYEYFLVSLDGQQASQVVTDVKGVKSRTLVDGRNRPVYEERQDADNPQGAQQYRQTWSGSYDVFENLIRQTQYDWRGRQQVAQVSTIDYDDWNQQRCVTGPDGVKVYDETNPIGTPAWKGVVQRSWREGAGQVSGKVVTYLNLFEKPDHIERFETDGTRVSTHQYGYDGLGRTVKEIDARDGLNEFRYDGFDRMVSNTLPGGATVFREYAEHSAADLQTRIRVNAIELGVQVFNGLGLMIESITGGRSQKFTYEPGQTQPATVLTARGHLVNYDYQPQLGNEPSRRRLPEKEPAEYVRDGKNARLVSCKEDGLELQRQYFSTGELKREVRVEGSRTDTMAYDYSLAGLLLHYDDVLGQRQTYTYDDPGRLIHTRLGTTSSEFAYDGLGQLITISTQDSASGQQVTISLEYDGLGRETLRTFDLDGLEQQLTQEYNAVDLLTRRTLREGQALLRDETYQYDARARLVQYDCEGSQPPVDPYGQVILGQVFRFDVIDNITRVATTYRGPGGTRSTNNAVYYFEGTDPAQLTRVTNTAIADGYPALIKLEYDLDGNMTFDERGRSLKYDPLSRLIEVSGSSDGSPISFGYNPLDNLSSSESGGDTERRFYQGDKLVTVDGSNSSSFMRGEGVVFAEHQAGAGPKS